MEVKKKTDFVFLFCCSFYFAEKFTDQLKNTKEKENKNYYDFVMVVNGSYEMFFFFVVVFFSC